MAGFSFSSPSVERIKFSYDLTPTQIEEQSVSGISVKVGSSEVYVGSSLSGEVFCNPVSTGVVTYALISPLHSSSSEYEYVTASGTITVAERVDAISVAISNPTVVLTADLSGVVSNYSTTPTAISVTHKGSKLQFTTSTAINSGFYKISTSTQAITAGSSSVSGTDAYFESASNFTSTSDTASITYTITGKTTYGTSFTYQAAQTFSKSKTGATGATGSSGIRGTVMVSIPSTTGTISASEADAAILSATGSSTKVNGDIVLNQKTAVKWNGTAWSTVSQFINGSLVVSESITSSQLAAGSITSGKIAAGTITANEIAAGTVTVDKLSVGSGTNLIPNPTFQNNFSGWYIVGSSITRYQSSGITVTKAADYTAGVYARLNGFNTEQSKAIPVKPGTSLRIKFDVTRTAGVESSGNIGVTVIEFSDTGSVITSLGAYTATAPLNQTVSVSSEFKLQNTTYGISLQIGYGSNANSAGSSVKLSNISITEMAAGELIVDGSITANKLTASSLIGNRIANVGCVTTAYCAASIDTTLYVSSTSGFPATGALLVVDYASGDIKKLRYSGKSTDGKSFTGVFFGNYTGIASNSVVTVYIATSPMVQGDYYCDGKLFSDSVGNFAIVDETKSFSTTYSYNGIGTNSRLTSVSIISGNEANCFAGDLRYAVNLSFIPKVTGVTQLTEFTPATATELYSMAKEVLVIGGGYCVKTSITWDGVKATFATTIPLVASNTYWILPKVNSVIIGDKIGLVLSTLEDNLSMSVKTITGNYASLPSFEVDSIDGCITVRDTYSTPLIVEPKLSTSKLCKYSTGTGLDAVTINGIDYLVSTKSNRTYDVIHTNKTGVVNLYAPNESNYGAITLTHLATANVDRYTLSSSAGKVVNITASTTILTSSDVSSYMTAGYNTLSEGPYIQCNGSSRPTLANQIRLATSSTADDAILSAASHTVNGKLTVTSDSNLTGNLTTASIGFAGYLASSPIISASNSITLTTSAASVILRAPSNASTITINLPTSPIHGMEITFFARAAATLSLVATGATIYNNPTSIAAGSSFKLKCTIVDSVVSWYKG